MKNLNKKCIGVLVTIAILITVGILILGKDFLTKDDSDNYIAVPMYTANTNSCPCSTSDDTLSVNNMYQCATPENEQLLMQQRALHDPPLNPLLGLVYDSRAGPLHNNYEIGSKQPVTAVYQHSLRHYK